MPSAHQLKITLRDVKPRVWRRLLVPSDLRLSALAEVLMTAMGWEAYHLYEFHAGGATYYDPRFEDAPEDDVDSGRVRLSQVAAAGGRFAFDYDFGDGWSHQVVVESVSTVKTRVPVICLAGKGACPPEDSGGPWGYADLVEAIADPTHERHVELAEWAGADFDAAAFDLEAVNAALQDLPGR